MSERTAPPSQHPVECDLVMKGGITSGIVYPPAVLRLAKEYRFRCIGGTSAGAIAAAVTAAAEWAREGGGFERLGQVAADLAKPGFLKNLFQPEKTTRPLMDVVWALLSRSGTRAHPAGIFGALGTLTPVFLRHFPLGFLLAAAVGLGLWLLNLWAVRGSIAGWGLLLPLLFVAVTAWLGGLAWGAWQLARVVQAEIPENFFGICNGFSNGTRTEPVLTEWLSASIQRIAGKPEQEPLTIGDLEEAGVTLRMIASNLAQGRPYSLPFRNNRFLFREEEFRRLFPRSVVDWMVAHAVQGRRVQPPDGYHFIPRAEDFPVVVAARMSLSFPVLISAVPLYAIQGSIPRRNAAPVKLAATQLQQHWFSDGGISSNFPIHLFDSWLPTRPTFGITLMPVPHGAPLDSPRVILPKPNVVRFDGTSIQSLWGFLSAIWNTAQNHRDNLQSELPSYRERIVQVFLDSSEGGLNLDMDPAKVQCLMRYGEEAGETLRRDFAWDQHRWVRYRVLMAQLEEQMQETLARVKPSDRQQARFPVDLLLEAQLRGPQGFPYRKPEPWCRAARHRMDVLERLYEEWGASIFTSGDIPKPEPVLRVTPNF